MNWIYTKDRLPRVWVRGNWDGLKSDEILVEDRNGKRYIATLYSGFIDGDDFNDWYNNNDYEITEDIVRWIEIPY